MKRTDHTAFFLLLLFLCPPPLLAQDPPQQDEQTDEQSKGTSLSTLAPILVTAEKRTEEAQDIPASITVLDAQTIEDARIDGMAGIASLTPGL